MARSSLNKSRLVVGLVLVGAAVLLLLSADGRYATAGAVALGVLGLVSVAISRRK